MWRAADATGYAFGDFVKVAMLTGQRPGEISGMRRDELRGDTWILPSERVKNKKNDSVPLPRQALAIIETAPRISDEFVFSYGTRPMRCLHRAKHALDRASNVTAWTLHDLRRTCASGLARLGVSIAVIEQILNYRGGSLAGVAGVYIRHQFEKEKREALQRWADHVEPPHDGGQRWFPISEPYPPPRTFFAELENKSNRVCRGIHRDMRERFDGGDNISVLPSLHLRLFHRGARGPPVVGHKEKFRAAMDKFHSRSKSNLGPSVWSSAAKRRKQLAAERCKLSLAVSNIWACFGLPAL